MGRYISATNIIPDIYKWLAKSSHEYCKIIEVSIQGLFSIAQRKVIDSTS